MYDSGGNRRIWIDAVDAQKTHSNHKYHRFSFNTAGVQSEFPHENCRAANARSWMSPNCFITTLVNNNRIIDNVSTKLRLSNFGML